MSGSDLEFVEKKLYSMKALFTKPTIIPYGFKKSVQLNVVEHLSLGLIDRKQR